VGFRDEFERALLDLAIGWSSCAGHAECVALHHPKPRSCSPGRNLRPVVAARHDDSTAPNDGEVQSKEAFADNISGHNALKTLGYFRSLLKQYRRFESRFLRHQFIDFTLFCEF